MLEWLYHTAVTANNLAAFYEKYGMADQHGHFKRTKKEIEIIKHYYAISYKRKPNVRAACSLGYLAFLSESYREALSYYKKALSIRTEPQLYYNIAVLYSYLKQYGQAISYLNKANPALHGINKRQARLLLIYVYGMSGYKQLAREHFQNYISTYREVDMDLLQLAFVCQDYGFIDRHCVNLSKEAALKIKDVEVILRALYLVEKDKLADYFLEKCISNPAYEGKAEWAGQCQEVSARVRKNEGKDYFPKLQVKPILHKKMYIYIEPNY